MTLENLDIRQKVADHGLFYVDIARKLEIAPESLSRLMRCKLTQRTRRKILAAIEALIKDAEE